LIPHTDAHQAPAGVTNPYEQGMHHSELMRHLKNLNANIHAPLPDRYPGWFPGKEVGITCLWLGTPSAPGSRKVCAFSLGVIPQWTVKGPKGQMRKKGWRAIFARLIKVKAATKHDLEREFLVSLDPGDKKGDGLCLHCARAGKSVRATGSGRLCKIHTRIQQIVSKAMEKKKEARWLATLSPEKRLMNQPGRISSRVTLDIASSPARMDTRSPKGPLTERQSRLIWTPARTR
jgi:hypothetical protein